MKKLLFILLSALSLTAFAQQKKVAVYVMGDDEGINKVVGQKLVSAIVRSAEYSAVESTDAILAELGREQNHQRTGMVDEEELSRLGNQFEVQYVCVAAVSEAFNEKYLSARLIDVNTVQVERSASSSGAIQTGQDLLNAVNAVSSELLSSLKNEKLSNSKKVAVYVIKNEAGKEMGRVLGDKLVAGFTNSGRYVAIERTNSFLSQLNKEQKYQRTGAVDDNEIARLGKQFGVQYVCVAEVSDVLGEKFVSARLVDVETAEVANTHEVLGEINNMSSCLRVAKEIASKLSQATIAEQAEEARRIAEEQARLRAEQERLREEQERIRAAEEERKQREEERIRKEKEDELAYIRSCRNNGYVILELYDGRKYMLNLSFNNSYISFKQAHKTFSEHGKDGWRLPYRNELFKIIGALRESRYGKLCEKHSISIGLRMNAKYWCVNGKNLRYYCIIYDNGYGMIAKQGPSEDYTFAFASDYYAKEGITACAFYVRKL